MQRRIYYFLTFVLVVFAVLIARLYDLQVNKNDEMLAKVAAQRLSAVTIQDMRGVIYDRNMIPFTDNDEETNLLIFPQLLENKKETAKIISSNLGINFFDLTNMINKNKPFKYIINNGEIARNILKGINGVLVEQSTTRYGRNSIARHILGYIDANNNGLFGIEKQYNSYLKTYNQEQVGIIRDSAKIPLMGYGYRAVNAGNSFGYSNVKLTIDYHMQSIIESLFDKYSYEGSAVLVDNKTGDILAMVSRPNYEQNDISKYFNSANKELINKATYPYNLGSIFKIVVAYAALEEKIVDNNTTFFCPGYEIVDGQMKKCSSYNAGGHGKISFEDAFAKSCNVAFINLGLKLGHYKLIDTARKFGLGQYLGLQEQGVSENPGFVQHKEYVSKREIANISIGQGDLLVSPLQVVNMIATVANNGIMKRLNIVDSIVDPDGTVIKKIKEQNENQVFNEDIIKRIKNMMKDVVDKGTGSGANIYDFGGGAGKTSSAETGIYNGNEQVVHAWFGGFFPYENPKYSLAIVIENGQSGAKTAAPLFGEIASQIMSIEK